MVLETFWDCSIQRQGDYIVYYNEWGRAVGILEAIDDEQREQRLRLKDRLYIRLNLNLGRV